MATATKKAIKRITVRSSSKSTCPTCKARIPQGDSAYTVGESVKGLWSVITHFCHHCYGEVIVGVSQEYCDKHGGIVYINMDKGYTRPSWLHSVITSTITVLNNGKV